MESADPKVLFDILNNYAPGCLARVDFASHWGGSNIVFTQWSGAKLELHVDRIDVVNAGSVVSLTNEVLRLAVGWLPLPDRYWVE